MLVTADGKSTEATFVPERRRGLAKLSAAELMILVVGIALCSTGTLGVMIGIPVALGALYSGFFVAPKVQRGLYLGYCPHCGAAISAMPYQDALDCPSCDGHIERKDGRFLAVRGDAGKAA